ncbi:MAG: quinolinate synthase NadA [Deltaproteobacteria bacterium]|nr:quinolinate synthase NadA [Deltaproteobacteria bacterium]
MKDIFDEIASLKREKNAVILAHYYQEPDIQDVADFVGDSLELSKKAAATGARIIVFAGVHFMAETAKILNPAKKVLLPDLKAGCSLADSCPPAPFALFKAKYPGAVVISYINCSAEIKALSDYICTSSNAEKIVRSISPDKTIIFAPDKNLGAYLVKKTGRPMALWQGSCIVHETFSEKKIVQLKTRYPDALVIAHPECEEPILKLADHIGSTSSLLKFTQQNPARQFIVVTEAGIIHQMKKASPGKEFFAGPPDDGAETAACGCNECPHMKRNTLEKLRDCLRDETPEIVLGEPLRIKALVPIERMLALS